MASPLQSLLDLRRHAEEQATLALERAALAHATEAAEQERLVGLWRQALARLDGQAGRRSASPTTVGQAVTHDRYVAELQAEVTRAARRAAEHRAGALAAGLRALEEARAALAQAQAAVAAVQGLLEREQAEAAQIEQRRAEESACDLRNAAFVRDRGR